MSKPGFDRILCLCWQIKYESFLLASAVLLCGLLSSTVCILYLHKKDNVPPNISAATNEERRAADHRKAVGRHGSARCDGRAPAWGQLPVSSVSPSKSGRC